MPWLSRGLLSRKQTAGKAGGREALPWHLTPISREVCQAVPKGPSVLLSPDLYSREGRAGLGSLLARQLPQEHSPLLVPPGVARVMGSRGREYARLCIRVLVFPEWGADPLLRAKETSGWYPCLGTPECPGDIFVGCNSCQVSVASLTSLAKTPLEVILFFRPRMIQSIGET